MKRIINISLLALLVLFVAVAGCDKNKLYKVKEADPQAHFTGAANQTYSILTNPAPAYTITVGTTDVSDMDRTVSFTVTSPTGATAGTQYTLGGVTGGTLTIPKGQATASFTVQGNYASYTAGRKDTLVFTLTEPSVKVAGFSNNIKLLLRGPCFEGDIVLEDFLGTYAHTNESFNGSPYGPYTTRITSVSHLTATTGTVTVSNIWDNGWSPIVFTLDWTDPANRTAVVVPQFAIGGSNAGDINAAYAGTPIAVKQWSTPGTFSWCNGNLTLMMNLGVSNSTGTGALGYFNVLYQVNMAR